MHSSFGPAGQSSDTEDKATSDCGGENISWVRKIILGLRFSMFASERNVRKIELLQEVSFVSFTFRIHPSKEHLFEIVTPYRVFYVQVCPEIRSDSQ